VARLTSNLGYKLLALAIAIFLWGVANGSASTQRGFDLPIVLRSVPPELVVTSQSADVVNVRVLGSPSVLRTLAATKLEYPIDVSEGKPGEAVYEVEPSTLELPRGATIVSRSPARVEVKFEARGSRSVRVRAEVAGEPAQGFEITDVQVKPPRVQVSGARSEVLRLTELTTDTVDVTGVTAPVERSVRVLLGGSHVWLDEPGEVQVRVQVTPKAVPAPPPPPAPPAPPPSKRQKGKR
jgi:YbbR domain-containing protein